jgi:hypothetical protein
MIPFAPILEEGSDAFAMLVDLQNKYDWVLDVVVYSADRGIGKRDCPTRGGEIQPTLRAANQSTPHQERLVGLRLRPTTLYIADGLDSLIDALLTTVKSRLACQVRSYSPSGDIALKGIHRLHSCRPRVNPWLEAFGALLPPRRRRVRGRGVLSKSQTFKQNLTLLLQIFRCKYSSGALGKDPARPHTCDDQAPDVNLLSCRPGLSNGRPCPHSPLLIADSTSRAVAPSGSITKR